MLHTAHKRRDVENGSRALPREVEKVGTPRRDAPLEGMRGLAADDPQAVLRDLSSAVQVCCRVIQFHDMGSSIRFCDQPLTRHVSKSVPMVLSEPVPEPEPVAFRVLTSRRAEPHLPTQRPDDDR